MIRDEIPFGGMRNTILAEFANTQDLCKTVMAGTYTSNFIDNAKQPRYSKWSGDTIDGWMRKSQFGDTSYADRAQKYVDQFANLALADYAPTMDYNTQVGVLDYQAALAGDPMCLYGPTVDETDKSPVHIYLDCWTSCTVSPRVMETRGIAVLALALALSIYRPVIVKTVTGLAHKSGDANVIMTCNVPTAPMDLGIAAWQLSNPAYFRLGHLIGLQEVVGTSKPCFVPRLDNTQWQSTKMSGWLAERDNVHDVVFLPHMMDNGSWGQRDYALAWVKQQLERLV